MLFIKKLWYRFATLLKKCYCRIKAKHLSFETDELFFQQIKTGFSRYDIIVRLLAIENYYGKNDYGFNFYYRMQYHRKDGGWADKSIDVFKSLINSYASKGYDNKSEIVLDANLHLIDGSHRIALALYYNYPTISAKVLPISQDVFYSIEWFKINGFSDEECKLLEDRFKIIKDSINSPFICTIWHPARNFFEDITNHLSLFGTIKEVKDFHLNRWDYKFYTRGIYAVDDIEKWKIEKKLEYMTANNNDMFELRMVALEIDNPDFRLKESNNKTLSRKGEVIKKLIRDAYKSEINNYFHDIILHIGDNFYQNRHTYRLLTMPTIDVRSILEHIKDNKYVITKVDVPYMPSDFPEHYPLGKDIDIICADEKEYAFVLDSVSKDVQEYKDRYNIRVVKKHDNCGKEYRSLLRLEQEDHFLVFLFDISCRTGSLACAFTQKMVGNRREANGYYVPTIKYEILIRLDEYHNNMNKHHHIDYVKAHRDAIDEMLADKYLHFNWKKLISQ